MSTYPTGEPLGIYIDVDDEQPKEKFHHSLFFQTEQEAQAVEPWVEEWIDTCDINYGPAYDDDAGTWEFRFYTDTKMGRRECAFTVDEFPTLASYALNVEVYS